MTLTIDVRNLRLQYGDTVALHDLTFSLEGAKIYGLLGRNGSGKTSLLSVLAAFRKETAGEVRMNGQAVFENPEIVRQLCLIRETPDVGDTSEKVQYALDFAKEMRPNWDVAFADKLLGRFNLPVRKKMNQLSRGQRASLGIILGLAARTPVTMFDESYLGLDAPSRYIFYEELLADFIEHPRTFIISTHLIEEVSSLFEEVVIIDKGRLLLHEETETLRLRGAEIIGPADRVDRFVEGMTVLNVKELGRTKAAVVYGDLGNGRRDEALSAGLDLEPIALQDLFVHLTTTQRTGEDTV